MPPENPVAIAGNQPIERITQKTRHEAQDTQQIPWSAQPGIDRQNAIAVTRGPIAIDHDHRDRISRIDTETPVKPCPDLALHGCQPKPPRMIMTQDELGMAEQRIHSASKTMIGPDDDLASMKRT